MGSNQMGDPVGTPNQMIPLHHLTNLTPREAQIATLRDIGWTHRRIANYTQLTESTIRATIDRAARKIAATT